MKFVSIRDLRAKSSAVWKTLKDERDLVLTHNGKPFAIMTATDEDMFEETLKAIRQARAAWAVRNMQEAARRQGKDRMTMAEIDRIIQADRRSRKK